MIHAFNERGSAALDPQWAGGRPRLISDDDVAFIVTTATTRPGKLGCPFTRWSIRKLVVYLARCHQRRIVISRERLRLILREAGVSFQRTRTWKESTDPDTVPARRLQAYLRWRNANARHPYILTAQRRERARVRSERQQR